MKIDLHTHSNFSDGTDRPSELINKALSQGITTLALTDHDTVAGWDEAMQWLRPGMELVLGSEISCQTEDGISVHMLGLLFNRENQPLQEMMAATRDNRLGRMERIITKMNAAGIEITIEEVHAQLSEGATLGRPHLADALVAKGLAKSRDEVFADWLANSSPFYVAHYSPTPEVAIAAIKAAGGVAVIAHPLASLRGRVVNLESFDSYIAAGLDGIEVKHRDQTPEQQELLFSIAASADLAMTGSSDYHGNGKMNELAEFTTDPDQWEKLEARADDRRVVRKAS
ncbi:MAG: PHP domain-containing protein [Actinomycetes bacterium]